MPATLTFWKRFEDLFSKRSRLGNENEPRDLNLTGLGSPNEEPPTRNGGSIAPWSRWRGRHAELRENFLTISESLDRMHEQFAAKERRDVDFADALGEIRSALGAMASQQEQQHELIDRICDRIAEIESRNARVVNALNELPAALRNHSEAVEAIGGQLAQSRETDKGLRKSLDQFEDAAREMRESGAIQLETLSRLQNDQEGSREELETALQRQNRRFMWIAGVASFLSLAALGALVANLVATGIQPLSKIFG